MKTAFLSTILFTFLMSSLRADFPGTDKDCEVIPTKAKPCQQWCGSPFTPTVLYAFNNELSNDNIPAGGQPNPYYPFHIYCPYQKLIFDNIGKLHGPISATSNSNGTTFTFCETGTYEVTVVVYLPTGISGSSFQPMDRDDGSMQALINNAPVSIPCSPAVWVYFSEAANIGNPLVYQFVHTIKAGQKLTISSVKYLLVNNVANSCSIKIVRLY
jgi:hypothetical protein